MPTDWVRGNVMRAQTVYETFPGWDEDISAITEYDQLPANAKRYIARVEELMGGVQCKYIGVGPGRAAMVVKPVSASVSTDSAAAGLYAGTTDAADPIEQFCASEPDADECRVYED
jgi:hypothetical protein